MSAPVPGLARFQAELRSHLQHKNAVFSPQINDVLTEVIQFSSASLRDGLRVALTRLSANAEAWPNRTFIELCEAIVEHHIRNVTTEERELFGKSLIEAYMHFAGPQYVFEPVKKTRFMRSLRRHGAKGLASTFLSLHLFNMVCREICDEVASRMPNQQAYEMYMYCIEGLCRDVVAHAIELANGEMDERWAPAVVGAIEAQLFRKV